MRRSGRPGRAVDAHAARLDVQRGKPCAAGYSRMTHRDQLDFEANVKTPFLPLMIDLCREHDIRLCMVRFKARSGWGPEGLERDRKLRDYTRELASYLESRDVALIDYTPDAYIDESCFSRGDHMNRKGKAYITPRLTQDLVEFLRNTDAFDE